MSKVSSISPDTRRVLATLAGGASEEAVEIGAIGTVVLLLLDDGRIRVITDKPYPDVTILGVAEGMRMNILQRTVAGMVQAIMDEEYDE